MKTALRSLVNGNRSEEAFYQAIFPAQFGCPHSHEIADVFPDASHCGLQYLLPGMGVQLQLVCEHFSLFSIEVTS